MGIIEENQPPPSLTGSVDVEKSGHSDGSVSQPNTDVKTDASIDEFPDGGLRAWTVAAGAGGVLFSTLGYSNCFGVFQAYYMFHQLQDQSPDNIAWIGAIQAFLVFAAGAFGGPLFDRYGAWVCF
jgi:hypothetical protein